jgi:UDP-N-acetylglucosamine---dolichyl-phosphate N-acetylglucosaminyltransferase
MHPSVNKERGTYPIKHVTVVVPAYNEERTIAGVIRGLKAKGFTRIIVVDDGSSDRTSELACERDVVVLRHTVNRGLGGALATGIRGALRFKPDIIVTFDGDGQHDPSDIAQLTQPIEKGEADVVIGSRQQNSERIPSSRRLAHRIANLVTYCLFGVRTSDSQSGLRAFTYDAASRIRITTNGMEVSSEIVAEIARNSLRYTEVSTKAIYTEYSLSKGQSLKVGLRTLRKLVMAKAQRMSL